MSKGALAGTSLVAAVPGGFLAYLTVRAFLDHADQMVTVLQVVTGATLLFSVLMVLSPFAILLFVRSPASDEAPASPAKSPSASSAAVPVMAGVPAAAGMLEADETVDEFGDSTSADEFEAADDFASADDGDLPGSDDSSDAFALDDDAFEIDEDDTK